MGEWQKGDLAWCVNDRRAPLLARCSVKRGRIYEVEGVRAGALPHSLFGTSRGLYLKGVTGQGATGAVAAQRFRKVTPPAADDFDREVIELMSREPVVAGAGR